MTEGKGLGTAITTTKAYGGGLTIPSAVSSVLADGYGGTAWHDWDPVKALAILKRDGHVERVPELAERAAGSLRNDPKAVTQHLTILGGSMAGTREFESAAAWLAQMQRLTADIATDLLIAACDEWQRGNRFLPSVAEIRALAEPRMERRRRAAARLEAMARYLASGQPIPALPPVAPRLEAPRRDDRPMTPAEAEELNEIMNRIGLSTRYRPDGQRYEVAKDAETPRRAGPPRRPTREDYIALGVSEDVLDGLMRESSE